MEDSWSIEENGVRYTIRASLKTFSLRPQLTVYLDGQLIHQQTVMLFLGELCRVRAMGRELVLRIRGYGALGRLVLLVDGAEAGLSLGGASPSVAFPPPLPPLTTSLVETHTIQEDLGEEVREIDNSGSSVTVHRKILVSREWTQTYTLEEEKSVKATAELSLQGVGFGGLKAAAEILIKERYQLAVSEKRVHSEELNIEILKGTRVKLILLWKQVWQCGEVSVRRSAIEEARLPYRVSMGPTFDQRLVDC